MSRYTRKSADEIKFEIVESDAATYKVTDEQNVFFTFVPFTPAVMRAVVANIRESLEHKPRQIWMVYHGSPNSLWAPEFEAIFTLEAHFNRVWYAVVAGSEISVYTNMAP